MGGHALTEGLTERKCIHDYLKIKTNVFSKLDEQSLISIYAIKEMPDKESFGDLDLLVHFTDPCISNMSDLRQLLKDVFNPTEIVRSGNIISIDVERFQVDFITCDPEYLDIHLFCLNYGDRGMILGISILAVIGLFVRYYLPLL